MGNQEPIIREEIIKGNYFNKHTSKNIFVRYLLNNYKQSLIAFIKNLQINNVFEIGSGEGFILQYIHDERNDLHLTGSDIDVDFIKQTANSMNLPNITWCVADAESLPLKPNSIDLILACEVMEHLNEPKKFLSECVRVHAKYYLFTVPQEPLWRILNMARFKYVLSGGNTPGHVQHWTYKGFLSLVNQSLYVVDSKKSFPWTFVLAKSKINNP